MSRQMIVAQKLESIRYKFNQMPKWESLSDTEKDVLCYWIEDLESGEFKQITDIYRKGNSYCAVGLLLRYRKFVPLEWNLLRGLASDAVIGMNDNVGLTFEEIALVIRDLLEVPEWV